MGNRYYDGGGYRKTKIDASGKGANPKAGEETEGLATGGLRMSGLSSGGLSTSAPHDWSGFEAATPKGFLSPGEMRRRRQAARPPKPATAVEVHGGAKQSPIYKVVADVVRKIPFVGEAGGALVDAFAKRRSEPTPAARPPRFDADDYFAKTGRRLHGWGVTEQASNADGVVRDLPVIPTIDEGHEMRTPGWMDATPAERKEILQPGAVDARGNTFAKGENDWYATGYEPAKDAGIRGETVVDPFERSNWTRRVEIDPRYGGGSAKAINGGGVDATQRQARNGMERAAHGKGMRPEETAAVGRMMAGAKRAAKGLLRPAQS